MPYGILLSAIVKSLSAMIRILFLFRQNYDHCYILLIVIGVYGVEKLILIHAEDHAIVLLNVVKSIDVIMIGHQ